MSCNHSRDARDFTHCPSCGGKFGPTGRVIPRRFKTDEELTVDEHAERRRAQRAGEAWQQPETDEYRAAARQELERAGFDIPADLAGEKPLEEMTPQDHFDRIRRKTR